MPSSETNLDDSEGDGSPRIHAKYPSGSEVVALSGLEVEHVCSLQAVHPQLVEQGGVEIEKSAAVPQPERRILGLRTRVFWAVLFGLGMFLVAGIITGGVAGAVVGKVPPGSTVTMTHSTPTITIPIPSSTFFTTAIITTSLSQSTTTSLGLPATVVTSRSPGGEKSLSKTTTFNLTTPSPTPSQSTQERIDAGIKDYEERIRNAQSDEE
ncbi:hypothetical protein QBC38DRAFT_439686 [Podospora fimiseda]|uniref:Transmembrane protein n=1 Tax=Podospora fimiseda TaxID=252190 RepID=A0AAN7BXV4_9PEZI|nr:hypothetical protein QBC38DRAFT_439686 [Podospora fimiseda]